MRPYFCFIIATAAICEHSHVPFKLTFNTASQFSSDMNLTSPSLIRAVKPSRVMPALLIRMSSLPYSLRMVSTTPCTSARAVTFAFTVNT